MLCLWSIAMDHVMNKPYHKGTILQRNYRKITILWSFFFNSLSKFHGQKNLGATFSPCYIQIYVILRCAMVGLTLFSSHSFSFGMADWRLQDL